MKKIFLLAAIALVVFSTSAYASKDVITNTDKISEVINEHCPAIRDYYNAGVIKVETVNEENLADGRTEYSIFYKFVKNYYDQDEIDKVLEGQYPDVYAMKKKGVIKDVSVYRFVDKNTGKILTNVAYNKNIPQRENMPRFPRRFRRR